MLKQFVVGWSTEGYEEAILDGVEKASRIASGMQNPHVALIDLSYHDDNGFRAELEISPEVIGVHENFNLIEQFEDLESDHANRYRVIKRIERERFQQMVTSHFFRLGLSNVNFYIPDFILVPLTGGDIENNMIEKRFHQAADLAKKDRAVPVEEPLKKANRHDGEPEPE